MMDFDLTYILQMIAISAIPVLFAITLHEVAHGWVAYKFGDSTAASLGRLSINPLKHIDLIGTVLVPIVMILTIHVAFGWARPVPVDWRNLRNPRRDMVYVAAAGPVANLLMALFWGIVLKLASLLFGSAQFAQPLLYMAEIGVTINVALFSLNLLPIPPLDGGRIAVGLLPPGLAQPLARIEPYGFFVLVALLLSGLLSWGLWPVVKKIAGIILMLTGN